MCQMSTIHLTEKCDKPLEATPAYINCRGAHPANHKQCPVYLEHLNKVEQVKNQRAKANKPKSVNINQLNFPLIEKSHQAQPAMNQHQWPRTTTQPRQQQQHYTALQEMVHQSSTIMLSSYGLITPINQSSAIVSKLPKLNNPTNSDVKLILEFNKLI